MKTQCLATLALASLISLPAAAQNPGAPFVGVFLNEAGGTLSIDNTVPGSPADLAGLRSGDAILTLAGTALESQASLEQALAGKRAGQKVGLVIARTLDLKLGAHPDQSDRPWLGVSIDESEGVRFSAVEDDSPADGAGLQAGDRLVSFDGTEIADFSDLQQAMSGASVGATVSLKVNRPLELRLGTRPEQATPDSAQVAPVPPSVAAPLEPRTDPELPDSQNQKRGFLGISMEDAEGGVRITEVAPGSPAANIGLTAGELVSQVDGENAPSAADIVRIVGTKRAGDSLKVVVGSRDAAKPKALAIILGERPDSGTLQPREPGQLRGGAQRAQNDGLRQQLDALDAAMRQRQEAFARELASMQQERNRIAEQLGVDRSPLTFQLRQSREAGQAQRSAESARAEALSAADRVRADAQRATGEAQSSGLQQEIRRLREDVSGLRKELAELRSEKR